MGLAKEFFDSNPSNAQIEQAMVGRKFRGQVGSRTYNGNKRNEIKNYYTTANAAATAAPRTAAAPAPVAPPAPPAAPAPPTAASTVGAGTSTAAPTAPF
jgi:hypothetical protein